MIGDLKEVRAKLRYYISALSLQLNIVSLASVGRVKQQMNGAAGDLKGIQLAVNKITAHLIAEDREGSVFTAYAGDDKAVWKEFRRELISDGFQSHVIHKHKATIKAYIKELGDRGGLDDDVYEDIEKDQVDENRAQMNDSNTSSNDRLDMNNSPVEAFLSQKECSLSSEDALLSLELKMPGKSFHDSEAQPDTYIINDLLATSNFEEKPEVETVLSNFVEDAVKGDCSSELELSTRRQVTRRQVERCFIDQGFRRDWRTRLLLSKKEEGKGGGPSKAKGTRAPPLYFTNICITSPHLPPSPPPSPFSKSNNSTI